MEFDGNFIRQGSVAIEPLQEMVANLTDADWDADGSRQKKFAAHQHTKTIFLIYDRDFRHDNPTVRPEFERFRPAVEPIVDTIRGIYADGGQVVRCLLARLSPGGIIPAHVDSGFSLRHVHRLHVPIITHDRVCFHINGENVLMKAGELWEINNCRQHAVKNGGETPRVHLIVDWAPPMTAAEREEYEESQRQAAAAVAQGAVLKYD
jgi:hypothetical protein